MSKIYVSTCPDVGENEGGYYCIIFADEDYTIQIDDFVVHNFELSINPDINYWIELYLGGGLNNG